MCYAVIACVTDYDSWWDPGKPVDVATVIKTLNENIAYQSILSSWQLRRYRRRPNAIAAVL